MSIPKKIHYCWFGGKEKPEIVNRCINSWKNILKDYEIIEWNECNFDIKSNKYVKEAYEVGKYAFVSDYVRVYVLYNYGGIYLDTDVEVFKTFNDLLDNESIWGFEEKNYIATSTIGAAKGNKTIECFLELYENKNFITENGEFDELTNVAMVSRMLTKYGLKLNGEYQNLDENKFYPQCYFSPYDYINCINYKNEDTYCIHHFYKSWLPRKARVKGKIKHVLAKCIGGENIKNIRGILSEGFCK